MRVVPGTIPTARFRLDVHSVHVPLAPHVKGSTWAYDQVLQCTVETFDVAAPSSRQDGQLHGTTVAELVLGQGALRAGERAGLLSLIAFT